MTRQSLAIAAMIGGYAVLVGIMNAGAPSPDLLATWMAGINFERGAFDAIYPALGDRFEMLPPEAWVTELRAAGHEGAIYPFIYPPLWAWVAAGLTRVTGFAGVDAVADVMNPLLLGATLWLAARMSAGRLGAPAFVLVGLVLFTMTTITLVALEQNQPQILVAFLTVLAIERAHAGRGIVGGAALALAASIKLYPALFALFWLVRGERRATASFILFGGALGLLSIWVAGWPLHAEFLAHMRTISSTVLVALSNHAVDPVIARTFFAENLELVRSLDQTVSFEPDQLPGWLVMAKPPIWMLLSAAGLIAAVAALALLARSRHGGDPLFWPLAITVIALLSPMSWVYHYIAAVVFLPALLDRLGTRWGALACLALLFPTNVHLLLSFDSGFMMENLARFGTLAMAVHAVLLLLIVTGRLPIRREGLAPA